MKEKFWIRIAQFWQGTLDRKGKERLLESLDKNEQELRAGLREAYDKDKTDDDGLLSAQEYAQVLAELHEKMGIVQRMPKRGYNMRRWSVAAALLLCVGVAGYMLLLRQPSAPANLSEQQGSPRSSTRLENEGSMPERQQLPDGSVVLLSPGAVLVYDAAYGMKDRVLQLQGRASFKVAHDSLRPFTVHAHGYATTALGTEFVVDGEDAQHLHIRLLTGKIVVKTADPKSTMEDQYLAPGDELAIDIKAGSFQKREAASQDARETQHAQAKAKAKPPVMLRFAETPLDVLFEILEKEKKTSIDRASISLDGLTFTGEFQASEPLQSILNIVCQMNGLSFNEQPEGIIIYKNKDIKQSPTETQTKTTN